MKFPAYASTGGPIETMRHVERSLINKGYRRVASANRPKPGPMEYHRWDWAAMENGNPVTRMVLLWQDA